MKKLTFLRLAVALAAVALCAGESLAGPVRNAFQRHRERVAERVAERHAGQSGQCGSGAPAAQPAKNSDAMPMPGASWFRVSASAAGQCPGGVCPLPRR